jgi:DNA-binding transcriptional LysR family regulator
MRKAITSMEDVRIFVLVARHGSFSRVAEQLETAASSISTAIGRLERQLGARLFQRTTRKVVLTQEGKELLCRGERLLEDFEDLTSLFQRAEHALAGRLRVDVPLGMATGVMMRLLPGFMERHPELVVEVFSSDRRVDVIAEGYDCVVRAGPVVDDSLVCRSLGQIELVNVASRAYIDAFGTPCTLADLPGHYLVNYQPDPVEAAAGFEYCNAGATRVLAMRHRITVNNSAAYGAACRAGFGIIQVPLIGVEAELASGALVQVMPDHVPAPMPINLLYPHRRNIPYRVRLFGDWLAELMASAMGGSPRTFQQAPPSSDR